MFSLPPFTDEELTTMTPQALKEAVEDGLIDIPSHHARFRVKMNKLHEDFEKLELQKKLAIRQDNIERAKEFQLQSDKKKQEIMTASKTVFKLNESTEGRFKEYVDEYGSFARQYGRQAR